MKVIATGFLPLSLTDYHGDDLLGKNYQAEMKPLFAKAVQTQLGLHICAYRPSSGHSIVLQKEVKSVAAFPDNHRRKNGQR